MNELNLVLIIWLIALMALFYFGRKCYALDRHCGFAFLLGFMVFIPGVLYLASEIWILAFE